MNENEWPDLDWDDLFFVEREPEQLCHDCGRPADDSCGFCGEPLCSMCSECGAGFCNGPHTQEQIEDYGRAMNGG